MTDADIDVTREADEHDWLKRRVKELEKLLDSVLHAEARPTSFQADVDRWMHQCFGAKVTYNTTERNYRFLEEALGLVQSLGCTKEEALMLVDYVYSRPVGDPVQVTGGVRVTLSALCTANHINEECAATGEFCRISDPKVIEKIREKELTKPRAGFDSVGG